MFIWPNSNAFDEPIIRGSSGMVALLFFRFMCSLRRCCSKHALGDAYFRAHVLPQLQSNNPHLLVMLRPFSEYQLIESKSLNIQWNAGVKELQLNGYPLSSTLPCLSTTAALLVRRESSWFINNQPRTKREAMKHYIRNINLGQKRFQSITPPFILVFTSHWISVNQTKLSNYSGPRYAFKKWISRFNGVYPKGHGQACSWTAGQRSFRRWTQ